jgi:hypothetical protein
MVGMLKEILEDIVHDLQDRIRLLIEREREEAVAEERALTDKAADVLSRMVVGWKDQTGIDLAEHPDVVAFFAEYREARKNAS